MDNQEISLRRQKLKAVKALEGNDFQKAKKLLRQVCKQQPRDIQAWLLLSSVYGQAGNFDSVVDCCQRAIKLDPSHAQAYGNLGNAQASLGRHEDAMAAYRKALELAPRDAGVMHNLGSALQLAGRPDEAVGYFQRAVAERPGYAEAHYGLANVLNELWRFAEAIPHYQYALQINPRFRAARLGLARTLNSHGSLKLAETCLRESLEIYPDDEEFSYDLASNLRYQGRFGEALEVVDRVLAVKPDDPNALAAKADLQERTGDLDRAYALVRTLAAADAWNATAADVFLRLCRRFDCCDEAIEVANHLLARGSLHVGSVQQLHYALGKLYDKLGAFDEAFAECKQANEHARLTFDVARNAERVDGLVAGFGAGALASMPRASVRTERPIFIVGMPRSGTSLVEQIVASHPKVFGAGELNDINDLIRSLPTTVYPQRMRSIGQETLDELAMRYIDRLREFSVEAERVTDKLPGNFRNLGLIQLLFPEARVLHCVRDPLDTCLSIYLQSFSYGHAYATDLSNIGAYYNEYLRLMEHWRRVLDIRMLEVSYRELVTDQERVSRRLIDFCGLAWDDRCLHFHETQRSVATASYDQVRRPIYTGSLERWKHYEPYLGPLQEALARGGRLAAPRAARTQAVRGDEEADPGDPVALRSRGDVLLEEGRVGEAIDHYRRVIGRLPHDARTHCRLGNALEVQGNIEAAVAHYQQALRIDPRLRRASLGLGGILSSRGDLADAEACYRDALKYTPNGPRLLYGLADTLRYQGRYQDALAVFHRVWQGRPDDAVAAAGIADLYERQGEYQEAYRWVRGAVDTGAPNATAAEVLLRLCQDYGCCDEAIALANRLQVQGSTSAGARRQLHYALARHYDKVGRFDEAFAELRQANDGSRPRYDHQKHRAQTDRLMAGFCKEALARMPRASLWSERPIFVVGMARSGTTLVEQILASHPRVCGGGELHDLNEIVQSLPETLYPLCMNTVSQETVDGLAQRYLSRLDELSTQADRVTDKMPGNFQNLGLVAIMLPGARVIHCVRDPLDTCLSIYFQDLGLSHPYASDLRNIGLFYREYERLMAHWREVMDIAMLEVSYRELVQDQERVSRELIEFCGLDWDDACLRFHQTKRAVATASYDQVRRPMYKSSLGRWHNYERHVGPLQSALAGE